jgi:CheY-like chemotaxis protein
VREHLLIIDDDRDIAEALVELLEGEGYVVSTAPDGAKALAWLEENEPPHAILLDLMMPVMDGFAFRAEQLAREGIRDIPTLVLTAGRIDQRVRDLGTTAVLRKPVDLDVLLGGLDGVRDGVSRR